MKLWIIYNSSIKLEKMLNLIRRLYEEFKKRNCEVILLKNDEIIMCYDNANKPQIRTKNCIPLPDGVLFWDKDIMLAKHLEEMGIRLFNSSSAIETCDDKVLTQLRLSKLNIPVPKSIVAPFVYFDYDLNNEYLENIEKEICYPMIIKEAKGSFGMQVHKVDNREELKKEIMNLGNRKFLFQEFIEYSSGKDIRVNIVGNRIIGAMLRTNPNDFRANVTLGAKSEQVELTNEQEELALLVHKTLGLDFSGVDLLFSKNGKPIFCEVNSNPNFLSFEKTTGLDYCNEIIDHIFEELR